MDNLFVSLALFKDLHSHFGMYACGTVRADKRGFPEKIIQQPIKQKAAATRAKGTTKTLAYIDDDFEVLAASYYDTKPVQVFSSLHTSVDLLHLPKTIYDVGKGERVSFYLFADSSLFFFPLIQLCYLVNTLGERGSRSSECYK